MTEAASSEIRRNSHKFEKQFSEIPSYFLKLVAFVTTSSFNLLCFFDAIFLCLMKMVNLRQYVLLDLARSLR